MHTHIKNVFLHNRLQVLLFVTSEEMKLKRKNALLNSQSNDLTLIKMALLRPDVEWPKKGVYLQCLLSS